MEKEADLDSEVLFEAKLELISVNGEVLGQRGFSFRGLEELRKSFSPFSVAFDAKGEQICCILCS